MTNDKVEKVKSKMKNMQLFIQGNQIYKWFIIILSWIYNTVNLWLFFFQLLFLF